jgi:hypothetical protein
MKRFGKILLLTLGLISGTAVAGEHKFYLTPTGVAGDQALTACAPGYHMASLWEIFDPSNLTYDTKLGFVTDDSGSGPPTARGWIRTGFQAEVSNNAGQANCNAWKSSSSSDYGTIVGLFPIWGVDPISISPWAAHIDLCSDSVPVWCVQ